MDRIVINATHKTPLVELDARRGFIAIKGRSTPEDPDKTYKEVIQWIEEYLLNPRKNTTIDFYFEYLNSSSTKVLVYLMNKFLIASKAKVTNILVNWTYSDDDMFEFGKDLADITEIQFNFIFNSLD